MARLTVIDGPDLGNEYEFEPEELRSEAVVLGRDPRARVALSDNAISREHCRLRATPRGFRVVDLGSRNRTYVNGDPVEDCMLRDGDVLRIGDTDLKFEDDGSSVELFGAASTIIKKVPIDEAVRKNGTNGTNGNGDAGLLEGGLERAVSSMKSLLDAARTLGQSRSVPELLERYLSSVTQAVGGTRAAYLVKQRKRWVSKASHSVHSPVGEDGTVGEDGQDGEADEEPTSFRVSASIVERAVEEQSAILSESTGDDERFSNAGSVVGEDIRSALAAPVTHRKKVLGVVYIDQVGVDRPFDSSDLELLSGSVETLSALLQKLEAQNRLAEENRNLLRSINEGRRIIGDSGPMQDVLDFIQRAAPTPMTVLIEGETGTGKELVASSIHYGSPRNSRPFIALNCAALPENLIESELFGHERGAFTSAHSRKKGRFELADSGTVFLDEIGELSLACQAKLLRLLEERCFERVGGTESIQVDVRIIAATNKDLLEAASKGEFREDLYYRLSVLNVRLPPLRERREDIPALVDHFVANTASGGRPKAVGKKALKKLEAYSWPGNVRQLRNVIESATVLGRSDSIEADDLVLPDRPTNGNQSWEPISLQELEKIHILRVLDHTKGNKKKASEILGIERCTLYSKLKNYDL